MKQQKKLHHRSSSIGHINNSELIKSLALKLEESETKIKMLEGYISNLVATIHEKDGIIKKLNAKNQDYKKIQETTLDKRSASKNKPFHFKVNPLAQSLQDISNVDQNELNIKNRMESMRTFEINKMPTLFQRNIRQNRSLQRIPRIVSHTKILQLKPGNIGPKQQASSISILETSNNNEGKQKLQHQSSFKLFESFLIVTGETIQLNTSQTIDSKIAYSYPTKLSYDKQKTISLFCYPSKVECIQISEDQKKEFKEESSIIILNSEFTTNNKTNKIVSLINPNHYLYGICLKTYSTVKINSYFYKIPTTYVILTYFPFVKFFLEILSATVRCNIPQNGVLVNQKCILQNIHSISQLKISSFPITFRYKSSGNSNTFSLPQPHYVDTLTFSYATNCLSKLDPNILCDLLLYFLLQYSIIIYSSNLTFLSEVILLLLQIVKPLKYPYPVIVNLPDEMQPMLGSPFPCLLGLKTKLQDFQQSQIYFDLDSRRVLNRVQLPKLHYVFDYVRNSIKSKFLHQNQLVKKIKYIVRQEILNSKEKHSVMSPFLQRFKNTQIYKYYHQ